MPIELTTETWIHRILRHMESFKGKTDIKCYSEIEEYNIPKDEEILGVYKNERDNDIVVTDKSLLLKSEGKFEKITYQDIEDVSWYPEQKQKANAVKIILDNGTKFILPINGKTDNGPDVFEFVRFLMRV